MIYAGAGTSWSPVGWVIGVTGVVLVLVDAFDTFIAVSTKDTSSIPNVAEIEAGIKRANEIAGEEVYDLNDY